MTRRWRLADTDWNHWPDGLSDEHLWPVVAGEGLGGIEIGVYSVTDELSAQRVTRWRSLTAAHRVQVVAILLSLPADRWPGGALVGHTDEVAGQVLGCARACRRLGLSTLGLWSGADPAGTPWHELVDGVRQARDAAERGGVRLAIEYKPGTAVPDATAARELAAQVPGVGTLLDVGHSYAAGEDPVEVVHTLRDLLWHVHLGDAAAGLPDDDLPLGRVHDVRPVLDALDAMDFTGVASFDLYGAVCAGRWTGRQAVEESLVHLRGAP